MSYIAKALKKIQDIRQNKGDHQPGKIVYLTDSPETWPKTILRVLLVICFVLAVLISITVMILTMHKLDSKQIEVINLEKTVKIQEKRINEFITAVNKNQSYDESQLIDLDHRLKQENEYNTNNVNNLTLTSKDSYLKLKDAIIDDKQQIDTLNSDLRALEQKVATISPSNVPAKDVTIPTSGN